MPANSWTGRCRWTPRSFARISGRNVIERAFNGFKHWRGLATRYDKHAVVYRGGLVLAAALIWAADLVVTTS
jgi:transposase